MISPRVAGYFSFLAIAVLINIFLFPLKFNTEEGKQQDGWVQPSVIVHTETNIDKLLNSGFWGEVDPTGNGAQKARQLTPSEEEALQLQSLISQIKAIVVQGKKELILAQGIKSMRVKQGENLPDTQWEFLSAGGDWIELKNLQSGDVRKLRLFTSATKRQ